MNKKLEEIWYQVPPDYYEKGLKTNLFQFIWHTWKWLTMKKILQNLNPKPAKILDIGCASGHITAKLAIFFPQTQVYGLDSYERAVRLGQKLHPEINFKVGDAHKLPFTAGTFDLITCVETLEHLENPEIAMAEIKRVLKKKGKLLVGQDTDNKLFRLIWFFWTKGRGKVWRGSHVHPLNVKELEKLIIKTGLKIKLKMLSHLSLEIFFLVVKS